MKFLLYFFFSILAVLGLTELGLRTVFKDRADSNRYRVFFQPDPVRDSLRCFTFAPNRNIQFDYFRGSELLFSTRAEIDSMARRLDLGARRIGKKQAAIFLGGSDTFGAGVGDDETLPAQFAKLHPEFRTYNYGYPGAGPNQSLALIRDSGFREQFTETKMVFVYIAVANHIRRAAGSCQLLGAWTDSCRYFEFSSEGRLQREGTFSELRPWFTLASQTLFRLKVGEMFLRRWDVPLRLREQDLLQFQWTVGELERTVRNRFPGSKFLLVVLDKGESETKYFDSIVGNLSKEGVAILDLRSESFSRLPKDPHLSGAGYAKLAARITHWLEEN